MITWMQKHKKYLIITIWISTIAFIGAGFVGWGQYNYSNKAGAIAEVGEITLSRGDLQKSYSNLYAQYNEMFQGNFDEEKAKAFGLQHQALKQLTDQALLLNLAIVYDITVSDKEILAKLMTQQFFFENGVFNKGIYKQLLSRNNLTMAEYESDLKKQILISKLLKLLPVTVTDNENEIVQTAMKIADKIEYKVLSDKEITIDTTDAAVKTFWETRKNNYMTEVSYQIQYFKQKEINATYTDAKISAYYNDNKTHFKNKDGKILALSESKKQVIIKLNEKATKDMALRNYVAYKKGKLDTQVELMSVKLSQSNNIFNRDLLEKVSKTTVTTPYIKPLKVDDSYYVIKLIKTIPSKVKSFTEAKESVLPLYIVETKKEKLLSLAKGSVEIFSGITSEFLTVKDVDKLDSLTPADSSEFLEKLFNTDKKSSYIVLNSGKIILYKIVKQKLLTDVEYDKIVKLDNLKNSIFNESLIKNLNNTFNTKILVEGL